ncbi:hypothetical protein ACFW7J_16135 [Streptomyces sp. NPDC059525]|uniref:hypothetical protein n=1 Tax=Streptomyces sp. NPDC059525 TaxID=3346857 RepID=UPI0036911CE4
MRKARTVRTLSSIALASALAVGGGAATTAFAAGTPSPSPSTSAPAAGASVTVPSSPVKPGDAISVTVTAPAGSKNLTVSSAALGAVRLTPGGNGTTWTGTATVADVKDGGYGVALTGSAPDGAKLQATAQLTVKAGSPKPKPKPTPAPATLQLSTDFGRPGDKVVITVKSSEKDAYVKSAAFAGGRVDLKGDGKGTFTGTATVAKDVKTGYYGIEAFAGGKRFDTVKFSVEAKGTPDVKPLKPLTPGEYKTPKGSVNTGQAPADA